MSPVMKRGVFSGPPTLAKVTDKGSTEICEVSEIGELTDSEVSESFIFFINEDNLSKCPQVEITFVEGIMIIAILDSGSEVNLLSEVVYEVS
jgi:hypothetical protein